MHHGRCLLSLYGLLVSGLVVCSALSFMKKKFSKKKCQSVIKRCFERIRYCLSM